MKLLLDTHVVIWALTDPNRIGAAARAALEDGANTAFVSAASLWEICIKQNLGKLTLEEGWKRAFESEIAGGSFTWLPISRAHCFETLALPWHHRDPFDRLLIAQARVEQAVLVTEDGAFPLYEVQTIWRQ